MIPHQDISWMEQGLYRMRCHPPSSRRRAFHSLSSPIIACPVQYRLNHPPSGATVKAMGSVMINGIDNLTPSDLLSRFVWSILPVTDAWTNAVMEYAATSGSSASEAIRILEEWQRHPALIAAPAYRITDAGVQLVRRMADHPGQGPTAPMRVVLDVFFAAQSDTRSVRRILRNSPSLALMHQVFTKKPLSMEDATIGTQILVASHAEHKDLDWLLKGARIPSVPVKQAMEVGGSWYRLESPFTAYSFRAGEASHGILVVLVSARTGGPGILVRLGCMVRPSSACQDHRPPGSTTAGHPTQEEGNPHPIPQSCIGRRRADHLLVHSW